MAVGGGRGGGGAAPLLLAVLALAAGAAAWNYRRNAALEAGEYRPYRGYATADLDALIAATEQELAQARRDYQRGPRRPAAGREPALLGDQIREFERVQRASVASRELGGRVLEREAALERLRAERARREPDEGPIARFLRLAFVYRG
jgi:hypothetical protein